MPKWGWLIVFGLCAVFAFRPLTKPSKPAEEEKKIPKAMEPTKRSRSKRKSFLPTKSPLTDTIRKGAPAIPSVPAQKPPPPPAPNSKNQEVPPHFRDYGQGLPPGLDPPPPPSQYAPPPGSAGVQNPPPSGPGGLSVPLGDDVEFAPPEVQQGDSMEPMPLDGSDILEPEEMIPPPPPTDEEEF